MLEDFSLRINIAFGFGCWHNFLSTSSPSCSYCDLWMCSQLYSREHSGSCHMSLGVLSGGESRACLLLSHSLLKFADNISLHSYMFSSDVILNCFHLPWPLWAIYIKEYIKYKNTYIRICFLSLCWCPSSVCIGLVEGETDVIPVLFLCSILFTHFCIVARCSAL